MIFCCKHKITDSDLWSPIIVLQAWGDRLLVQAALQPLPLPPAVPSLAAARGSLAAPAPAPAVPSLAAANWLNIPMPGSSQVTEPSQPGDWIFPLWFERMESLATCHCGTVFFKSQQSYQRLVQLCSLSLTWELTDFVLLGQFFHELSKCQDGPQREYFWSKCHSLSHWGQTKDWGFMLAFFGGVQV